MVPVAVQGASSSAASKGGASNLLDGAGLDGVDARCAALAEASGQIPDG